MNTAYKIVIFVLTELFILLAAQSWAFAENAPVENAASTSEQSLPFKYTGNLSSRKFHRPRCPYSRMMCDYKRVKFHFRCQAVAEGYVPCRYCLPAKWTTVTCAISRQSLEKDGEAAVGENKIDKNEPLGTPEKQPNISSP